MKDFFGPLIFGLITGAVISWHLQKILAYKPILMETSVRCMVGLKTTCFCEDHNEDEFICRINKDVNFER